MRDASNDRTRSGQRGPGRTRSESAAPAALLPPCTGSFGGVACPLLSGVPTICPGPRTDRAPHAKGKSRTASGAPVYFGWRDIVPLPQSRAAVYRARTRGIPVSLPGGGD